MRFGACLFAFLILNAAAVCLPRDRSSAMAQSKSVGWAAGNTQIRPVKAPLSAITGVWKADGVAYAPWTLTLQLEGSKVTGTVSQGRYNNRNRQRATTLVDPVDIYDGAIRGNIVSFKCVSPGRPDRIISFSGKMNGDEIRFTRSVRVRPGGDPGEDGIFGASGAQHFLARRVVRAPSNEDRDGTSRSEG